MGELILRSPLLPGASEKEQIDRIVNLLGAPNDRIWPGFRMLPFARSFRLTTMRPNTLNKVLSGQSEATINFVNELLTYDPARRLSAREALSDEYFYERPIALDPSLLPTFPSVKHISDEAKRADAKLVQAGGQQQQQQQQQQQRQGGSVSVKNKSQIKSGSYSFEFGEDDLPEDMRQPKRSRR